MFETNKTLDTCQGNNVVEIDVEPICIMGSELSFGTRRWSTPL